MCFLQVDKRAFDDYKAAVAVASALWSTGEAKAGAKGLDGGAESLVGFGPLVMSSNSGLFGFFILFSLSPRMVCPMM